MKISGYLILAGLMTLLTISEHTIAQELSVSNIPQSLLRGANSVVREQSVMLIMTGDGKYNYRKSIKLTILNEKALDLAHLMIYFSKGEKVTIRTAAIYDAAGVKIKSIRQSDMKDYSTAGDLTLYSDSRVIFYKTVSTGYPFTVYFDYEISNKQLYMFEDFSPYFSMNQSIENSSITLMNSAGIPFNIKKLNIPEDILFEKTDHSESWKFTNLLPLIEEPLMPETYTFLPTISFSPEILQFNNYTGRSDTWENYGKWCAQLMENRKNLSSYAVSNLNSMVSHVTSKREKVKILYKYLQSRTHYISISEGIGGIQPHKAEDVDDLGYGDCKDLSNYMVAMLEAIGIKAYYTKIKAGKGDYQFVMEQPGHQSNHIIVCVPAENDTIWLECTSQVNPFGHLGGFTDNRYALMIKDDHGTLVKTPEYTIRDNFIRSGLVIDHGTDGTAGKGTIVSGGLLMDEVIEATAMDVKDQVAWVNQRLEINDFTLINHQFRIAEDPEPEISLDVELALKSFFTGANGRLFANLNLNNVITAPVRVRSRKFPLYLPYSFQTSDTLQINLPSGYKPEQLPVSLVTDERFGSYSMNTALEAGTIRCIRKFEIYKGTHAPEVYNAFYDFMQKAAIADSKQLVLIKEP